MALATDGNIKTVGKIGDRVYYYLNGVLVSRAYFIPVQPRTDGQIAWWMQFRRGVDKWQRLTDPEKEVFNQRSKRLRMSGFNLFMREFLLDL